VQNLRALAVVGVVAALGAAYWWARPQPESETAGAKPQVGAPAAKAPGGVVAFAVFPTIEDRYVSEPCSRVVGGGLSALAAAMADVELSNPGAIGVTFGDMTLAPGGLGRRVATYHYTEAFPSAGVRTVAAGEGELGLGATYVREALTRIQNVQFLCANAVDEKGLPVLGGWTVAKCGSRSALIVAVAGESLNAELKRRGSDIRLTDPQKAIDEAKAEALAKASRTGWDVGVFALFVHGTIDEAAALVAKTPGVTFAAAAHGAILPETEPRRVGNVPILYPGRGLRFGFAMFVPPDDQPLDWAHFRIGVRMTAKPSPCADALDFFRRVGSLRVYEDVDATPGDRVADPRGAYVGASRCGNCHIEMAAQFAASAHAKPSKPLLESPFVGTTNCMGCHQTGGGFAGGWKGPADKTSDLAAVSCEACHGPGEIHSATPKAAHMPKVGLARCTECHLPDRSIDFDAEATWKRMGHRLVR